MNTVISKDGTKIAYDQVGQGHPLILVGGAFSYRKFESFIELSALLANHFTVIIYDRRGRGDSTDTQPYAIQREVEDLEALIEAVGGSAYVWGYSSGACLALEAAIVGLNIPKLATYEPPYAVDKSGVLPPSDFVEHVQKLTAANRRGDIVRYFMTKMVGVPSIFVTMMRFMPGVWSRLKAVAHTIPYDALLIKRNISGEALQAQPWDAITMPTIVLYGEKSTVSLQHSSQALVKVLPNASELMLAGQTHIVKMDVLAPVLIEFFTTESVDNVHHFNQQLETA